MTEQEFFEHYGYSEEEARMVKWMWKREKRYIAAIGAVSIILVIAVIVLLLRIL